MSSTTRSAATITTTRPHTLTERPLDVLYLAYFGIHLLASVAIDAQLTYLPYSQRLFPEPLRKVLQDYLTTSKDPFLLAAEARSAEHVWFRVLLASETLFQIPCFGVAIWGLLNGEFRFLVERWRESEADSEMVWMQTRNARTRSWCATERWVSDCTLLDLYTEHSQLISLLRAKQPPPQPCNASAASSSARTDAPFHRLRSAVCFSKCPSPFRSAKHRRSVADRG